MSGLNLKILTPNGVSESVMCDSVHLNLSDDDSERGGGSYGIRQGHVKSMLLLSDGITTADKDGKRVLKAITGNGFAVVDKETVTVIVESCKAIE